MSQTRRVTEPLAIKLDYVTFQMDVVNEASKATASTVYEKRVGLSLRELRLMRFIATQPGLTITRLIEQAHVEKTLTSKSIAGLVRQALVVRAIDADDARQTNLYLTTEGARRVELADKLGQRMENDMMRDISKADIAVFRRCLESFYQAHDRLQALTEDNPQDPSPQNSPGHPSAQGAQ